MAPIPADQKEFVSNLIKSHKVMIFSKSYCPFCKKVKELFSSLNVVFEALELDLREDGAAIQDLLMQMTSQKTVPNVFINGRHVGGADKVTSLHNDGALMPMVQSSAEYEYNLVVIGGGSGGLAASKMAAKLGAKVAVFDFVEPTPLGTTWGLGGTCVNVGCIPKKLMHQSALLRQAVDDSRSFGWELDENVQHKWDTMKDAIQNHIGSLNWGYRVALRDKKVNYINSFASFTGPHSLRAVNKRGNVTELTADKFIIATGERPRYPDIPGAKENCITSDDLFSLPYCPGKTLVIGASYVSLECAGFLAGLGLDVTVMVRSILLRGFDQQMAELVGSHMERHKVKFIRGYVPTAVERLAEGSPGQLRVKAKPTAGGDEITGEYNTVMIAIGRDPCTNKIGLDKVGVQLDKAGYIIANDAEQSSVPNIFAIGDIVSGKPKLTPVAIQAGKLLAERLFGGKSELVDYVNIPTTVFTPLEYGSIGYSEEDAMSKFGADNIEVYHSNYIPLEWTVPGHPENDCYAKLVCDKANNMRVVGFHVVGPNAGEITQGYALGMRLGATKRDFDMTIGIHPTCAEIFTTLSITKSSGVSAAQSGC